MRSQFKDVGLPPRSRSAHQLLSTSLYMAGLRKSSPFQIWKAGQDQTGARLLRRYLPSAAFINAYFKNNMGGIQRAPYALSSLSSILTVTAAHVSS